MKYFGSVNVKLYKTQVNNAVTTAYLAMATMYSNLSIPTPDMKLPKLKE